VENTQHGGIDVFHKLQRDYWMHALDGAFQTEFNKGYEKALNKCNSRLDELYDDNEDLRARVRELEQENTRLLEPLKDAPKDNKRARPLSFEKSSVGGESSRNKKPKASQDTKKPAPGKGKEKASDDDDGSRHGTDRELYVDTDESEIEYCGESDNVLHEGIPLINRLTSHQSYAQATSQQEASTSTRPAAKANPVTQPPPPRDANAWQTSQRTRTTNFGRATVPGQMPDEKPSGSISGSKTGKTRD
jgi:hypothetical protein